MTDKQPMGIVAIITAPCGDVIATAADFDTSGYGGFKLHEAQRMRAKKQAQWAMVRAYCGSAVVDALTEYTIDCIVRDMTNKASKKGHRLVFRAVGYSDEITREIEQA